MSPSQNMATCSILSLISMKVCRWRIGHHLFAQRKVNFRFYSAIAWFSLFNISMVDLFLISACQLKIKIYLRKYCLIKSRVFYVSHMYIEMKFEIYSFESGHPSSVLMYGCFALPDVTLAGHNRPLLGHLGCSDF